MARPIAAMKSLLLGKPMETAQLAHERLPKRIALAVFASDNLSSSAYATEEMLLVLVAAGAAGLNASIPITLTIVGVVALIAFSYRETIHTYPDGGGAYTVAHENLGRYPGLVAGAALLIDYVLTVAVSVSAGIAAVVSAAPALDTYRIPVAVAVVAVITLLNLRGVRESGRIFAIPTYAFLVLLGGTIVWGLIRYFAFDPAPSAGQPEIAATGGLTLFLLMRGFSHGSTAVTGIEAIANGVPSFEEPAPRNAATTLAIMAGLLAFLFIGTTVLAHLLGITGPSEDPRRTVVSLIALTVFGEGPLFFSVQAATALILFLAANTSYAGFPSLGAALAKDRYAPRQLLNRGDRLAYSNGIIVLAGSAAALIVLFGADVSRLINLYVVGVFTSLTLSQAGMVQHWRRHRHEVVNWKRDALVNGFGAAATALVLVIVLATKFLEGAWIVVALAPLIVWWLDKTNRHYRRVARALRDPERVPRSARENHVLLLVGRPSVEERRAFYYAERIRTEYLRCIHFTRPGDPRGIEARWTRELGLLPTSPALETVPLRRSLQSALHEYIEGMRDRISTNDFITVIVSERIRPGPLDHLGSGRALMLKTTLLRMPQVVITDVPYVIDAREQTDLDIGRSTRHVVVLLVSGVHNATLHALTYAQTLDADEVHAVHASLDADETEVLRSDWADWGMGLPLRTLDSPHRDLAETTLEHIRPFSRVPGTIVTVLLPEFVVEKRWHNLLHNQNALTLKYALLYEPDVIVTSVPYHLAPEAPRR